MLYYICSPETAGFGKSESFPAEETQYTSILRLFRHAEKDVFFAPEMRLYLRQIEKGGMENAQ